PRPGASILRTSAPMSARIIVANGPAIKCEKSTTLIPSRARGACEGRGVCSGNSVSSWSSIFAAIVCPSAVLLKVEHERTGLRSRTADHDGLVRGLVFGTEEQIPVIGYSLDHPRFAGATNAFTAREVRRYPGIEHRIENCLAGLDCDSAIALRKP